MSVMRHAISAGLAACVTFALLAMMGTLLHIGPLGTRVNPPTLWQAAPVLPARPPSAVPSHRPERPRREIQALPKQAALRPAPVDIGNRGADALRNGAASPAAMLNPGRPEIVIGSGGFNAADSEYLPIVKVPAVYPVRAQNQGISGYCIIEYTVTPDGTVRDPLPVDCQPNGVFESASIAAAAKFKYKPRIVDGEAVEVAGVRNKFIYQLEK